MLYEPLSRFTEPTGHVRTRAPPPIFTPVTNVCTPVRKSLEKFKNYLNRQNSKISISTKRSVPDSDLNTFISISDSFEPCKMGKDGKKNDKSNKNTDKSPKSKAKPGKGNKKSNTNASVPVDLVNYQAAQYGASANELAAAILQMGKSASSCPEASKINSKHERKVIIIMVHANTRKYLTKPFWEALKQNPFKQEFALQMLTFTDNLPPVKSIKLATDDKNVIGAILFPIFMKDLDYVDPDGALSEVNIPSRKRKRGFGQGTLVEQPEAVTADGDMDTTDNRENNDFEADLPEKDRTEIKLVMQHVEREFVVLAAWIRNFELKFPKCRQFVMVNDVESKTVEPAGMIVLSTVFEKNKQNAKNDYESDFVFKNRELVCLGVARNIGISQVMVKYEEQKHKNKTTEEKCTAFIELQLTRGCRELNLLLQQAKNEEKKAKNLFTEEGAVGDPFADSL